MIENSAIWKTADGKTANAKPEDLRAALEQALLRKGALVLASPNEAKPKSLLTKLKKPTLMRVVERDNVKALCPAWGIDEFDPLNIAEFTHGEWDKIWPAFIVLQQQSDPMRQPIQKIGNFETIVSMPIPVIGKALLIGDKEIWGIVNTLATNQLVGHAMGASMPSTGY